MAYEITCKLNTDGKFHLYEDQFRDDLSEIMNNCNSESWRHDLTIDGDNIKFECETIDITAAKNILKSLLTNIKVSYLYYDIIKELYRLFSSAVDSLYSDIDIYVDSIGESYRYGHVMIYKTKKKKKKY